MKKLFLILLLFSVGIQAQTKKQMSEKVNKAKYKTYCKNSKKAKCRMKSDKDEQVKRIINLSQEANDSKKELVKKNNSADRGSIIYEETFSVRRMYLFVGLNVVKNRFLKDDNWVIKEIQG